MVTEPQQAFFQPLLEGLLASILDSNKKVQEAACSAFATFEEEAGVRLSAQLPRILQFLMHAFGKYQQKNMLILYDAIGTLAESVGDMLNQPQCVSLLMPPLMQRWQELRDDDRAIFPLFECLGSVATSLGEGFLPFAQPVYQRCLQIIQRTLEEQKAVEQRNQQEQSKGAAADYEYVDLEFIVCALDLLSGVTEGLGQHIEPLIPQSPVMHLIYQCFTQAHTRILTTDGFLFHDEIKTRLDSGQAVRFACYEVASQQLVYRAGQLVEPPAPAYLVDFRSADEAHDWQKCGRESISATETDASGHLSLRVTPDHRMYVQTGSTDKKGDFVPSCNSGELSMAPTMMTASDLLLCHCPTSECPHRTTHIRFTAYAAAGYSPALPPVTRTRIQQQLDLSDEQFLVFVELLGYWLLSGSVDRARRTVCFGQLRQADMSWLQHMLDRVGLCAARYTFSLCDPVHGLPTMVDCCVVDSPAWFAHFDADFNSSGPRHIPQWMLLSLSAVELHSFIRGLQRASDRCFGTSERRIHTVDPHFRDQLLQVLMHAGHSAVALPVVDPAMAAAGGQCWTIEWASAINVDGTASNTGSSAHRPLVRCSAGGVTRVPYSAARDGGVWCVTVDHPDHLIVAQRAERHKGVVTDLWRPVIVGQCMSDRDPDVRQSAFALLGDLSKAACTHLLPFLSYFLPLCAINLNPHYSSVCNNASWAVGELAIKAGREPLLPHVEPLMNYLILILCPPAAAQWWQQVCSITTPLTASPNACQCLAAGERLHHHRPAGSWCVLNPSLCD